MAQDASPPPAFKAFIDFKFLKENLALVGENCSARNVQVDCEDVARLHDEFVAMKTKCDEIRQRRNDNSKAMKVKSVAGLLFWYLDCLLMNKWVR